MAAMIVKAPLQWGQCSRSISNEHLSYCTSCSGIVLASGRDVRAGRWDSSGGQYSHSPRSLQMRALIRPALRHLPRVVRLAPSFDAICFPVSQPARTSAA